VFLQANVSVMSRRLPILLLLAALLTLTPLAYATNVDPGWGGLYDDGDFDDVILCITGASAVVESQPLHDAGPVHDVVTLAPSESDEAPVTISSPYHHTRAPPEPSTLPS
jgi:hypothetical protein